MSTAPVVASVEATVAPEVTSVETSTPEVVETPSVETPETPVETAQPEQTPTETEDGRVIPLKYREIFKNDKYLKGLFFADRALKQHFPGGVNEALKAKQTLETLGGDEGLQAIQAERQEWEALDTQFDAGDPKFVENIAAQNPEAFVKLMPSALEQFRKADPETYNHVLGRVVWNTLQSAGLQQTIQSLKQTLKANPEGALQTLDEIEQWSKGIESLAMKQPERKIDPEREKFQQEKKQFETEKVNTFKRSVATDVVATMKTGISKHLDSYLKADNRTISDETRAALVNNIDLEIGKRMNADSAWLKNRDRYLASMDRDKTLKFFRARIEQDIPEAVKKVYRVFYANPGTPKAQPTTTTAKPAGSQPGAQMVAKTPTSAEIDYSRTSRDMIWKNTAYLKGKKELVTWND